MTADRVRRPVVGITCSSDRIDDWQLPMGYVRTAYTLSCERAGLLPVLLPVTEDASVRAGQLDLIDGLLLSGGVDVFPGFYGEAEAIHPATEEADEPRDRHEIALVRTALARDMPVLAICRGMQLLNVALGGTLIQDLPTGATEEWSHRQTAETSEKTHCISLSPESRLSCIFGGMNCLPVNSHHHQAVRDVAAGLSISARAGDGAIEALEMPGQRFVVGVQWHPENLSENDAPSRALFAAFAAALGKTPLC